MQANENFDSTWLEVEIPKSVIEFAKNSFENESWTSANSTISSKYGVVGFFTSDFDYKSFIHYINNENTIESSRNKREYGDYQTKSQLTNKIVKSISKKFTPNFILEPSCGKGNFITSALEYFNGSCKIIGVEIYLPYVKECKCNALAAQIKSTRRGVDIHIIHASIFDFDIREYTEGLRDLKPLVIGNPPWVMNSDLSSIDSRNLPFKKNIGLKGLDAITGKSNFDIAEYIALGLIEKFHKHKGYFALLIKTSVSRNIMRKQKERCFKTDQIKQENIDSKKEFNVSVCSALFSCRLGYESQKKCRVVDFYTKEEENTFGWVKNKFVYDIEKYKHYRSVDSKSPFVWRQGIKHDASKIMELEKNNNLYINKINEEIQLESDLVYPLLKSSDLKYEFIQHSRLYTIVTQQSIGQPTRHIKDRFPRTYDYLNTHSEIFEKRKSSIYKGKPRFSIFGIGDYSFKMYKIAISGMYNRTRFSFVGPIDGKPVMLDDTCYFIGFDDEAIALKVHAQLNSELVQGFLKSIIFPDAKRKITKDILMRIKLDGFKSSEYSHKESAGQLSFFTS